MGRAASLSILAVVALAGCRTPGDVRLVRVPPPPPPLPSVRYAITTTASIETGTRADRRVELRIPLVADEPEAQTVELTSVRICPVLPSRIESDASGNRVLRVDARGPASVTVTVTANVRRRAVRTDLARAEERALTDLELQALGAELGRSAPRETLGLDAAQAVLAGWKAGERIEDVVERLRARGFPARVVRGIAPVTGEIARHLSWIELYLPGLAWVPAAPGLPLGVLPERVVSIARGSLDPKPGVRFEAETPALVSALDARVLLDR